MPPLFPLLLRWFGLRFASLSKWVLHVVSGRGEVERLCLAGLAAEVRPLAAVPSVPPEPTARLAGRIHGALKRSRNPAVVNALKELYPPPPVEYLCRQPPQKTAAAPADDGRVAPGKNSLPDAGAASAIPAVAAAAAADDPIAIAAAAEADAISRAAAAAPEIVAAKSLPPAAAPNLLAALAHIARVRGFVASRLVTASKHAPFSSESTPDAPARLAALFAALLPGAPPAPPIGEGKASKRWGDIGFQGADPATDFRGGGVLAMRHLEFFVARRTDAARTMLAEPRDRPVARYPFACASVSFTALVVELAEKGHLDAWLIATLPDLAGSAGENNAAALAAGAEAADTAVAELYADLFEAFHAVYIASDPQTVMDYPRVFRRFREALFEDVKRGGADGEGRPFRTLCAGMHAAAEKGPVERKSKTN